MPFFRLHRFDRRVSKFGFLNEVVSELSALDVLQDLLQGIIRLAIDQQWTAISFTSFRHEIYANSG